MKKYLICIHGLRKDNTNIYQRTTIYGDTPSRPFMIANNLWNYATPWNAAQRLEKLAKAWEENGIVVNRVYGTVEDMPVCGDRYNATMIIAEWGGLNFF